MNSSSKHSLKWKPPGPSQEARKITSPPEKSSRTLRKLSLTASPPGSKEQLSHQVKQGLVQPVKKPKAPRCEVKRQRHPFRHPFRECSQGWNETNLSEPPKPSEPSRIGSDTLSSDADRKEERATATSKGAFNLTSDPRVCDTGRLSQEEGKRVLEEAGRAKALVVTLVYQDGTIQLDPEQVCLLDQDSSVLDVILFFLLLFNDYNV